MASRHCTLAVIASLLASTEIGCGSSREMASAEPPPCPYPDLVLACDNRHVVESERCKTEDRGDASMTVRFYESVDYGAQGKPRSGPLLLVLHDRGEGIPCRIIDYEAARWIRVELATGEVGYIDREEPAVAGTPLHWGPCAPKPAMNAGG